jgi:hypothetical protein
MEGGITMVEMSASDAGWRIAEGVCLPMSVQRDMEVWNAGDWGSSSICASFEREACRLAAVWAGSVGDGIVALFRWLLAIWNVCVGLEKRKFLISMSV